ncbi:MAG: very short patch repair endonuclease [Phycisphaerales bacterium JB050]
MTTDVLTKEQRRRCMSAIKSSDTKPELAIRSLVHRMGFRFRLHRRDLPGTPDLVFPRLSKVIFVHGCFWHRHPGCRFATTPVSRREFWLDKFHANRQRDCRTQRDLQNLGWDILVIWECEIRDEKGIENIATIIRQFLNSTK